MFSVHTQRQAPICGNITQQQLEIDHTTIELVSKVKKNATSIRPTDFRLLCWILLWILQNANKRKRDRKWEWERERDSTNKPSVERVFYHFQHFVFMDVSMLISIFLMRSFIGLPNIPAKPFVCLFIFSLFPQGMENAPKFQWIFLGDRRKKQEIELFAHLSVCRCWLLNQVIWNRALHICGYL